MNKAKKIYINKNDEAALVIERLMDCESVEVVLSIPKFSRFAQSESNFHLLKKEADALKKSVSIESVDDKVLELAESSDIPATNPFFANPERQFSDIIPRRDGAPSEPKTVFVSSKAAEIGPEPEVVDRWSEPDKIGAEIESQFGPEARKTKLSPKISLVLFLVLAVSGGLSYLALRVLPEVEVRLVAKKENFSYTNAIVVDKAVRERDVAMMKIPGQVFIEKRNATLTFPANGKKYVSKKAGGKITIYNAYSDQPQKLVAATRFAAPDGKIFRLASAVTVPGAKIVDGKIVPSSVEAGVVADQAGEIYNIGPVSRFEIPGFKGTPRYSSFYGESTAPMAGGYVGELAYPTDEDIKKAKTAVAEVLEAGAKTAIQSKIPSDFKMVENAFLFSIAKQSVNPDVNEKNEFSIFAEGEVSLMAFRDADITSLLEERAVKEKGIEFEVKNYSLGFGMSKVDMIVGKMTISVDYKADLARVVDAEDLRAKILAKSVPELKAMLLEMPELEGAQIKPWPFWVKSVPSRPEKVEIVVE